MRGDETMTATIRGALLLALLAVLAAACGTGTDGVTQPTGGQESTTEATEVPDTDESDDNDSDGSDDDDVSTSDEESETDNDQSPTGTTTGSTTDDTGNSTNGDSTTGDANSSDDPSSAATDANESATSSNDGDTNDGDVNDGDTNDDAANDGDANAGAANEGDPESSAPTVTRGGDELFVSTTANPVNFEAIDDNGEEIVQAWWFPSETITYTQLADNLLAESLITEDLANQWRLRGDQTVAAVPSETEIIRMWPARVATDNATYQITSVAEGGSEETLTFIEFEIDDGAWKAVSIQ